MTRLTAEFNEYGVMIAYVNSQGILQYVAADRYIALQKKIAAEYHKKDQAIRAQARREQFERENGLD